MATLRQRLHRMNASGSYDVIHLETEASLVLMSDGSTTVEETLTGEAGSSHNHSASNITSDTLALARGGTGMTANPYMLINLDSAAAASVFTASPRLGVTGKLPIANGGSGGSTIGNYGNVGSGGSSGQFGQPDAIIIRKVA